MQHWVERGQNKSRACSFLANIYFLKVDNRNTRKKCEVCLALTIKTPKRHY